MRPFQIIHWWSVGLPHRYYTGTNFGLNLLSRKYRRGSIDHSRLCLYYLVRLPVSKASPVTIDLPVPILGHNFLNLNDSRLLVGSVSNFIYEKKTKKAFYSSHTWWNLKLWSHRQFNETFVHSCLASGMLTESTNPGIMPFLSMKWTLTIFVNEISFNELSMNQWFRCIWWWLQRRALYFY